ncbi:hypothetical protein D3C71_1846040 [compost metagenome]
MLACNTRCSGSLLPTSMAARMVPPVQGFAVFTSNTGLGHWRSSFQSSGVSRNFFSGLSAKCCLTTSPQPSACCTSMMVWCRLSCHACSVVTL